MEQENKWNPEVKFGPSMASPCIQITPYWIKNIIGELSMKFQLTTHHSKKAMAIEWHWLPTCGFYSIRPVIYFCWKCISLILSVSHAICNLVTYLLLRKVSHEIMWYNDNTDLWFGSPFLFHAFNMSVIKCSCIFKCQFVSCVLYGLYNVLTCDWPGFITQTFVQR